LTQENPEFNSFAISLRLGYFPHRLTGLIYLILKRSKIGKYQRVMRN
jgi:hypothetical protein